MNASSKNNYDFKLLDNLHEGCQFIDFAWKYIYLNNASIKQFKKLKEEMLNHSLSEVFPGIEQTSLFSALQSCMIGRIPSDCENEFIFPDGSKGLFKLRVEPVPEGICIFSIDITEHIDSSNEINYQISKLQALRNIDLSILGSTDSTIALNTVLTEIFNQLHVDAAVVLLLNPYTQKLEYAAGYGFRSNDIKKSKWCIDEGYAGNLLLQRKHFYANNISLIKREFARFELIEKEGFTSYYVSPLVARGKINGVVELFHRSVLNPSKNWFDFFECLVGQASLAVDNGILFDNLNQANTSLVIAYNATIEGWSRALDLRDKETEGHSLRVTEMTVNLARYFHFSDAELNNIKYGALLHDIGKMGVSDSILLKPGKLTDEEFLLMQKHTTYAYELLYPIRYLLPSIDIPYCHHEKWDGTGYPRGLKGELIPLPARLFAVVDVWDALKSDRPYRKGWPEEKVVEHISSLSGTHFDPKAVKLFNNLIGDKQDICA